MLADNVVRSGDTLPGTTIPDTASVESCATVIATITVPGETSSVGDVIEMAAVESDTDTAPVTVNDCADVAIDNVETDAVIDPGTIDAEIAPAAIGRVSHTTYTTPGVMLAWITLVDTDSVDRVMIVPTVAIIAGVAVVNCKVVIASVIAPGNTDMAIAAH